MTLITVEGHGLTLQGAAGISAPWQATASTEHQPQAAGIEPLFEPEAGIPVLLAAAVAASYYARKIFSKRTVEDTAKKPAERSLSYAGTCLVLKNAVGDITISEAGPDTKHMQVTLQGRRERIDKMVLEGSGESLVVGARELSVDSVVSKWMRGLARALNTTALTKRKAVKITAIVPPNTDLEIAGAFGNINSRGEMGDLNLEAGHLTNASFQSVRQATINVLASSCVHISQISGAINLKGDYDSRTSIGQGAAAKGYISLGMSARADIGAVIGDLSVLTAYDARAKVASASGKVKLSAANSSIIHINSGRAAKLEIDAAYGSRVSHLGVSDYTELNAGMSSKVAIGATGYLKTVGSYDSEVTVNDHVLRINADMGMSSSMIVHGTVGSGHLRLGYDADITAEKYDRSVTFDKSYGARVRSLREYR